MHVILLNFALLHYELEKLSHFAFENFYYILRRNKTYLRKGMEI